MLAREDTLAYRTRKFIRRNKALVAAAALVFLSPGRPDGHDAVAGAPGPGLGAIARAEQSRAERRLNDVRNLARSLLFDYQDAIKNLPRGHAGSGAAGERRARLLDALSREVGGDLTLHTELAAAEPAASSS